MPRVPACFRAEVIRLGTGTGYTGYNNRCSVKGSAPCREMASEMFGYQLYQRNWLGTIFG